MNLQQFDTGVSSWHFNNVPVSGGLSLCDTNCNVLFWFQMYYNSQLLTAKPSNLNVTLIDRFQLLNSKTHMIFMSCSTNQGKNYQDSKL